MSTFTAVGVRLDVDGPRPVAPPHSLLNTQGVVVAQDQGRWLNGVNQIAYPEDTPSLWEPCSEGTFRVKTDGEGNRFSTFDPFVCYIPITCSSLGLYQQLQAQAETVLEATYSMGVEQGLAAGIVGSLNPYLADSNLTVLGSGAVLPHAAFGYLENAIASTGRKGMIHATPAVVAAAPADVILEDDQGNLRTRNGTPVVSGDGYVNIVPDGLSEPGGGMDYIYATGPVEVRVGPLAMTSVSESLDRSDNTLTFRAERYVLATWDTALQVGVLCNWASCCGENLIV